MALFKHYKISDYENVYLWKISESLEELILLADLSDNEKVTVASFKSETRQKEWCAVRALLQTVKKGSKIRYNFLGAPYIDENQHISISHTGNYAAIALSNNKLGLDIEQKNKNFTRISSRFVNEHENSIVDSLSIDKNTALAIIWSFKEAVFKFAGCQEVDFKKDIQITSIENTKIEYKFRDNEFLGMYIIETEFIITFTNTN